MNVLEQLREVTGVGAGEVTGLAAPTVIAVVVFGYVAASVAFDRDDSFARSFLERDGVTELAVGSVVALGVALVVPVLNPDVTDPLLQRAREYAVPVTGLLILASIFLVNVRVWRSDEPERTEPWYSGVTGFVPELEGEGYRLYVTKWAKSEGDGLKLVAVASGLLGSAALLIGFKDIEQLVGVSALEVHLAGFPLAGFGVIVLSLYSATRLVR